MRHGLRITAAIVLTLVATTGSEAARTAPLRIAYVVGAGAVPPPRSFDGLLLLGFTRAERQLHFEGRVQYVSPALSPSSALRTLARQGYDLVIEGVADGWAVDNVAPEFPRVRFLMIDLPFGALHHRSSNVTGSIYRAEEAGYLAGYLAALMEARRPGRHLISAVGGKPVPGVTRWLVGFRAGVRSAAPQMPIRVDYSHDWVDTTKCRRLALSQIAAGSGVVFNVAGACGLGALAAAKSRSVWGLGVDLDQSYLGDHILTSAILRLAPSISDSIGRFVHGRLPKGGDVIFDLRSGGVGLGKISPRVPKVLLEQVERIRRQIVAGTIRVPRVS